MAESLELQNAMLSMKCCLCKNVLSVPPIMVLSQDGTQLKCGRCKNNNFRPSICRNFAFENVAMFTSFPCMYKDCNKIIPWKEVERHEDACDKKTIKCPIYNEQCEEIVQVVNLVSHFNLFHADKIFHNTFNNELFLINRSSPVICLLPYNGDRRQNFIMIIKNTNSSLQVYVASFEEIDECFTYTLKLSSTNNTSVTYDDQPIGIYDDKEHCVRCMVSCCNLNYYPHTNRNTRVNIPFKSFNFAVINPLFGHNPSIRLTITIVPKNKFKDSSGNDVTVKSLRNDPNVNDQCLKKKLRCPICMEYMISRIYNCEKGHVLCINCEMHLTQCPFCRSKLDGESRNFPLESLADELVFACIFSKNGCDFTGKLELLSQHERVCEKLLNMC